MGVFFLTDWVGGQWSPGYCYCYDGLMGGLVDLTLLVGGRVMFLERGESLSTTRMGWG